MVRIPPVMSMYSSTTCGISSLDRNTSSATYENGKDCKTRSEGWKSELATVKVVRGARSHLDRREKCYPQVQQSSADIHDRPSWRNPYIREDCPLRCEVDRIS